MRQKLKEFHKLIMLNSEEEEEEEEEEMLKKIYEISECL